MFFRLIDHFINKSNTLLKKTNDPKDGGNNSKSSGTSIKRE